MHLGRSLLPLRLPRCTHAFLPPLLPAALCCPWWWCCCWSTTMEGVDTDFCSPGNWDSRWALFLEDGGLGEEREREKKS